MWIASKKDRVGEKPEEVKTHRDRGEAAAEKAAQALSATCPNLATASQKAQETENEQKEVGKALGPCATTGTGAAGQTAALRDDPDVKKAIAALATKKNKQGESFSVCEIIRVASLAESNWKDMAKFETKDVAVIYLLRGDNKILKVGQTGSSTGCAHYEPVTW